MACASWICPYGHMTYVQICPYTWKPERLNGGTIDVGQSTGRSIGRWINWHAGQHTGRMITNRNSNNNHDSSHTVPLHNSSPKAPQEKNLNFSNGETGQSRLVLWTIPPPPQTPPRRPPSQRTTPHHHRWTPRHFQSKRKGKAKRITAHTQA